MNIINADSNKNAFTTKKANGHSPFHWLFGLLSIALRSSGELVRVVGEIHHTASESPSVLDKEHQADVTQAPKAYLFLKLLLDHGANKIHQIVDHIPSTGHVPQPVSRVRSAMNGVFGDKLDTWGHPLAINMELVDEHGHVMDLTELALESSGGLVLFIHGLCLSELDFQGVANRTFVQELRERGYGVGWIRYNSGQPIWENGAELSSFLEQHLPYYQSSAKPLVLIGHSMGGLLIRSATHYAKHSKHNWVYSLTHAAYLASPHHGAPMEKIGNLANSVLGVSPYSKPLMAMGNIRSRGIRSLRHGNITEPTDSSQEQARLPFDADFKHLLLGAKKYDDPGTRWLGDGLVPEDSAMAIHHLPGDQKEVERIMLEDVGHMRLLKDQRMYDHLRRWLLAESA